jgi:ABC-type sugar transport system substrate-binding protein
MMLDPLSLSSEIASVSTKITGINGTREAIDAIKSGKMLASGDYNGFVQGCIGVIIALRYLGHEEASKQGSPRRKSL